MIVFVVDNIHGIVPEVFLFHFLFFHFIGVEDYNFFNFEATVKGKKRMSFGVSYFKQIKVTEEMKERDSEITRSYMQKALAVVSTLPLFGYLKLRLAGAIKLYFSDFRNYELIDAAYKDLNKNVS